MSGTLMGMQGMGSNGLGIGGPQQQVPPGLMQLIMQHQQQGGGMMPTAPQIGQGGPMAPQLPMGQGMPPGMMPRPGMMPPGPPPQQPVGVGQTMQSMQQNLPMLLAALKGGQNGLAPQGGAAQDAQQAPTAPGQPGYLQMLLQHLQGGGGVQQPPIGAMQAPGYGVSGQG